MTKRHGERDNQMQTLLESANQREKQSEELLAKRTPGPIPGDLYSFPVDLDAALFWSVIRTHPEDSSLFLVVPADSNPLAGTADIQVPEFAAYGPLTLRCDRGEWLPREGFELGVRVGFIEDIYVALVSKTLMQLSTGEELPAAPSRQQLDLAPEYRNWLGAITHATEHVRTLAYEHAARRQWQRPRIAAAREQQRPTARTVRTSGAVPGETAISNNEFLVKMIANLVRGGLTPLQAMKDLSKMSAESEVRAALTEYERLTGRIRSLRQPAALLEPQSIEDWYIGPQPEDKFWPALERYLREDRKWNPKALAELDKASTKVLSLLSPPGLPQFSKRGLVLGHVQSGKTANFTALIAKAADVGYKFFIVLSGMHNGLRAQTQKRLQQELVNLNTKAWHPLTTLTEDFRPAGNVNAFLTDVTHQKVLCVVKKNVWVLQKLLNWLGAAHSEVLGNCPVLVIDDEADQASVNASGADERRTAINSLILRLLQTLPKAGYVGFTATPYANLFIDPSIPEDLYPRDFIVDLPRPESYFGPERIFGRDRLNHDEPDFDGLDLIRHVQDSEVEKLKPKGKNDWEHFQPEITPSLEESLHYFLLACACRMARGHLLPTSAPYHKHASMLVHTTLYADVHARLKPRIESFLKDFLSGIEAGDQKLLRSLETLWNRETSRVPPEEGQSAQPFDELQEHLRNVAARINVVVENSRSQLRLEYGDQPTIQVVIGGNTLSRGLTLEGLVVSFFVRASTAYDTLLQMGRWFGYRLGYADLPRIWMTEELENYFYDLATVEKEIRNDIARYELEGITPLQFAVRVRTHPVLSITSSLKMGATIDCRVSYAGRRLQTILFKHKDRDWLERNLEAGKHLIQKLQAQHTKHDVIGTRFWRFKDVPVDEILQFLEEYSFHENSQELKTDLIREYISNQTDAGALLKWNVAIVGRQAGEGIPKLQLGRGLTVPLLERSRLRRPGSDANIGVLMTARDSIIDLDIAAEELTELTEAEMMQLRDKPPVTDRRALLLLYPIAKNSMPRQKSTPSKRMPLDAVTHMLGVALVFPGIPGEMDTPRMYKTVDLSYIERETDELPADEAVA